MVRKSSEFPSILRILLELKQSQTSSNACASVALLNIVNNIPNIELGDNLRGFKDFTSDFSPALRGDAIANFDFVKQIHNSFARYVIPSRSQALPMLSLRLAVASVSSVSSAEERSPKLNILKEDGYAQRRPPAQK